MFVRLHGAKNGVYTVLRNFTECLILFWNNAVVRLNFVRFNLHKGDKKGKIDSFFIFSDKHKMNDFFVTCIWQASSKQGKTQIGGLSWTRFRLAKVKSAKVKLCKKGIFYLAKILTIFISYVLPLFDEFLLLFVVSSEFNDSICKWLITNNSFLWYVPII